ncbi:YqhR family membrane protein [Bacillus sp. EAC]|uniref:YqhR family membrane protein n=1 Tax=Bacillus sp. EAC TaxID=1978338 RepID=UPI000B434DA1|nr:YqhR family membrane protein [Bacillus sp. EAC]
MSEDNKPTQDFEQSQGQDQEKEQYQDQDQEKSQGNMNFNKIASIGFFGGVFWSTVLLVLSFFDFTQIGPTFVLERIPLGKWANGYIEALISIVSIGIASIIVAFVCYFVCRKFTGVLPGVFIGLIIWIILFLVIGKIAFDFRPVKEYSSDTIVTSICLFILYGTFITYSVSFAFQEQEPYLRGYSK